MASIRHRYWTLAVCALLALAITPEIAAQQVRVKRPIQPETGSLALPKSAASPKSARPHAAVFRIKNILNGEICLGTGTLIETGRTHGVVVTCAHLFDGGIGSISAVTPSAKEYQARLLAVDPGNDLAVLAIAKSDITPVVVASEAPQLGDRLTSCGYGQVGSYAVNRGKVVSFAMREGTTQPNLVEIAGVARFGDSGGPMFNDAGQLAGVLIGTDGMVVDGTHCGIVQALLSRAPHSPPPIAQLAKQIGSKEVVVASAMAGAGSGIGIQAGQLRKPVRPDGQNHQVAGQVMLGRRAVPGVKVELVGDIRRSSKADDDGRFTFLDVPPGTYVLHAEGIALNKFRRASVSVFQHGQRKPVDRVIVKFE